MTATGRVTSVVSLTLVLVVCSLGTSQAAPAAPSKVCHKTVKVRGKLVRRTVACPKPRPAPAPPPQPVAPPPPPPDPLATFKPLVASFLQQYLEPALTQVRLDASTYTALANGAGLAALQSCAATLTTTIGTPPTDPTVTAAFAQLQTMCGDFQDAGTTIRAGVAAQDDDKVNAGLDLFKAGLDVRDTIVRSLGLAP